MINYTVQTVAVATLLCATSAALAQSEKTEPGDPVIQSYSIDVEAKLLTDRRHRGISDTFNLPGAELTVTGVHESGMIGYLQMGSVSDVIFPGGNGLVVTGAFGYRWGRPDGWHFGLGVAQEWFPGAMANDAPTGIDWRTGQPTGVTNSKFDTAYGIFEFAYGIVEARYLYVLSKDLRGYNTATICSGTYLPAVRAGGDPTKAMKCYQDGFKNSGGSQSLDVNVKYPINGQTKLTVHAGYHALKNFPDGDLFDYGLGVVHTRWGLDFGAEVAVPVLRNRELAVITDSAGNSKRIDRTALILSMAKRF